MAVVQTTIEQRKVTLLQAAPATELWLRVEGGLKLQVWGSRKQGDLNGPIVHIYIRLDDNNASSAPLSAEVAGRYTVRNWCRADALLKLVTLFRFENPVSNLDRILETLQYFPDTRPNKW